MVLPKDGPVLEVARVMLRAGEAERALLRSHDDLRQLAWAVGHDLAEPLRSIVSYNQLLERRYKEQLDSEAIDFLAQTMTAATRMRALLTDLLTYSQVISDAAPSLTQVSMEAVFWAARMALHEAIAAAGARVTHDPLPSVRGNETRLTQLLQALLSNAVRFAAAGRKPEVHISVRDDGAQWVFSVTDNGQGIEERYHARIFEPFRRLHGREVPGSGLGLAMARAIADTHGGRIWLVSEPNRGSTFFFALPKSD
jgi:light-regulated signal transduction histidine kinase (bacteriophytochrome)